MVECCRRCKTPITQRNGVGRKKEFCSLECRQRVNSEHYNELRALGGYPNECRRSRWGGVYEALKVELMNRRQLG